MTLCAVRRVPYVYLGQQFADAQPVLDAIQQQVVASGDFTLGGAVSTFEHDLAAYTDLPYAVGVSNGTDALSLSLRALGIGHGDEVITAANSFVASAGAIAMVGARPVLVDVDETLTISLEAIERAITPRTRAILPVHWTGTLANMPAIAQVARQYGLEVVEDAAQALGATLDGQHAGSWGIAAGLSFHPLKILHVWGDGGAILTTSSSFDATLRLLRNHGLATRDDAVIWGTNARLSTLQAVVAAHGLRSLPQAIARRRELAATLTALLADLAPRVRTPVHHAGVVPVCANYQILTERRDDLRGYLLDRGIEVKVHYPTPIHLQTVGRALGYVPGDCPMVEQQARETLTLPLHQYLSEDDLEYMVTSLRMFFEERGA